MTAIVVIFSSPKGRLQKHKIGIFCDAVKYFIRNI